MSGLTKKTVYADKVLATILRINEGELVSYSEISKGLHKYIKDNGLTSPSMRGSEAAPTREEVKTQTPAVVKTCMGCGEDIPSEAVFCDLCGARQ